MLHGRSGWPSTVKSERVCFRRPQCEYLWRTTTPSAFVPQPPANRQNSDVVEVNGQMAKLFAPGSQHQEVLVHDMYRNIVRKASSLEVAQQAWWRGLPRQVASLGPAHKVFQRRQVHAVTLHGAEVLPRRAVGHHLWKVTHLHREGG